MKLYGELAPFWDLVSPPDDYRGEAALYEGLLRDGRAAERLTALELGCGGGHCASWMTAFAWTLTDVAPAMLQACRARCPSAEIAEGDMRSLRLGRSFDAVFVHDAVAYMTTEADLEAACRTAFLHCRPGGVALFAPDWTLETFAPGTSHGGSDDGERGARFLEWVHPLAEGDCAVDVDFVFLVREGERRRVVHDRHRWGVFASDVWLRVLRGAGFEPSPHDVQDDPPRRLFVARRP